MKELENIDSEEDKPVKLLKPILGIPPIIYVNALWLLVIGFFLFWVFSFIFKPQSTLTVKSSPSGSVVFWNGQIIGNTPLQVKIRGSLRGEGTLSVNRKGYYEKEEKLNLSGWSFPLSFLGDKTVNFSLDPSLSEQEIVNLEIQDLDYWITLGEPTYRFPSPPLFSQWESNFKEEENIFLSLLGKGFLLINSPFYWNDFKKSYLSHFSFAPTSSWELWQHLEENLNLPPQALGFYYSLLTEEEQKNLTLDPNFSESFKDLSISIKSSTTFLSSLPLSLLPIMNFRVIESSLFQEVNEVNQNLSFETEINLAPFYITRGPITKGQVELFLKSYAKWRPEYREGLIQEGLSDESYLKPFFWDEIKNTDPAVFIPYYFAVDFAQWINNTYLKGTSLKASLPSSLQWQVAMKNANQVSESSISYWFWMRESHSSSQKWLRTQENPLGVDQNLPLLQGEIRSLNNKNLNITSSTQASLPKIWTGPNLSFYLIIQEEKEL